MSHFYKKFLITLYFLKTCLFYTLLNNVRLSVRFFIRCPLRSPTSFYLGPPSSFSTSYGLSYLSILLYLFITTNSLSLSRQNMSDSVFSLLLYSCYRVSHLSFYFHQFEYSQNLSDNLSPNV